MKRVALSLAAVILVVGAVVAAVQRAWIWSLGFSAMAALLFGISWFAKRKAVDAALNASSAMADIASGL